MELTKTQQDFLQLANDEDNEWDGWFNRKDVFNKTCDFMPYTVGLSLYRKGLLETDPQNHLSGHDLSFRITEKGRRIINETDNPMRGTRYKTLTINR